MLSLGLKINYDKQIVIIKFIMLSRIQQNLQLRLFNIYTFFIFYVCIDVHGKIENVYVLYN